ncbi:hypothetical protein EDB92DRAFT_1816995 [Lactarius akahatsu]|uniref:Uncharacterized protein n=1 Tax=Lactarius akahatsu TaxID=416441 RepID=A0AAD4LDV5_9AGAM|nr:hypothetical protein EDB92DRAFT_1816995 [Lactarius akahatsu]
MSLVPVPIDEDEEVWFDAKDGPDSAWTPPLPPLAQTTRVADDTHPFEGVKTSVSSFSGSRHRPLFPRGALERPKDPDTIQPQGKTNEEEPRHKAMVPQNHPLYRYAQKKRSSGSDADDECPKKQPRPQLAHRSKPLPRYFDYKWRPKAPKHKSLKDEKTSIKVDPGVPAWRPLTPDPPTYDAIREHLAFCYRPGAKEVTYSPSPFPLGEIGAVHGFRKKYQPIKNE